MESRTPVLMLTGQCKVLCVSVPRGCAPTPGTGLCGKLPLERSHFCRAGLGRLQTASPK